MIFVGCRASQKEKSIELANRQTEHYLDISNEVSAVDQFTDDEFEMAKPLTASSELPQEYWEMSLDDAILIALQDTEVLRSLGATVLQNPTASPSSFDPAIQSTDPNFGIEAALAQFDTLLNSNLLYARNDDVFNNPVLGGGAAEVRDDVTTANLSLNKVTPNGTQFTLNNSFVHSQTDNPNVLFSNAWTTVWEATARQPLLQGKGIRFNNIAGPATTPGVRNGAGVWVSKINHDISVAQFESNLLAMINEVISAYWQLSLAHQNFEAVKEIRDQGLTTWNIAKVRFDNDLSGGEADQEAQAREQLFELQGRLLAAINGDRQQGQVGVLQAEADLRRLLNLPPADGRLIRTSDKPASVETLFSWEDLAFIASENRVELREQRSRIKQRELQLEAARNFTLPRLDAIATYRNNGFGDDLAFGGGGQFGSALGNALSNDQGEWEIGFAYDVPIGYRQANAGVKNAELALSREKAILREQRKQILYELGSSYRQVEQNKGNIQWQTNRIAAAREAVEARTVAFEADAVGFDELLQAQLRLLDSQLTYYNSLTSYEISKADLFGQSGRLFEEYGIILAGEDCSGCD